MAISDPRVVAFLNDRARPRAEAIRDLFAMMDDDAKKWAELADSVPNDDKEIIEDGRDRDGVSRISGADLVLFQAVCEKMNSAVNELSELPVITKICVRPLLGR